MILARAQHIETLYLGNNSIDEEGANAIATMQTLSSLDLSHNKINAEGAKYIAKMQKLVCLHLDDNALGDEGVKALGKISSKDLSALSIANNHVTSVDSYYPLIQTSIQFLYFGEPQLVLNSYIMEILLRSNLQGLSIQGSHLTDLAISYFVTHSKLNGIEFAGDNITAEQLQKF